jgi:protein MpaA
MDEPRWERLHRSTDRRPIETVQLGTGRERVAVMASLHGDETQSITLVDQLARYVAGHVDEFRDATVLFIRTPNPDGQAAKTPYNARHVDLNRNFPASNWKLIQSKHTGDKAASEVETRAIVRLISEFRPARLIHIKDSSAGGFVNHDGALRELAREVARQASLKVVQDLGQATTGSVESYTWTQLHVPSLTLLVPKEAGELAAWDKTRTALVATIVGQADPFSPKPGVDRQRQPTPSNSTRDSSWTPRKNSPSPSLTETTLPAFPVAVPDRGYLELPQPPSRKGR